MYRSGQGATASTHRIGYQCNNTRVQVAPTLTASSIEVFSECTRAKLSEFRLERDDVVDLIVEMEVAESSITEEICPGFSG